KCIYGSSQSSTAPAHQVGKACYTAPLVDADRSYGCDLASRESQASANISWSGRGGRIAVYGPTMVLSSTRTRCGRSFAVSSGRCGACTDDVHGPGMHVVRPARPRLSSTTD